MNTEIQNTEKLYYSISEVAEMTGLEAHVLRFWEKEFPQLRPKKNRSGNRIYQAKDIEIISTIKKLLYDDGYTIQGARNMIKKNSDNNDLNAEDMKKLIKEIKGDLEDLLKLFP
ncbi:MAG: MerR family transcriptional regulator [candidate division Zixibacteria bacterium]|nr:MerR family transcriptional regulator [candidate division Zixibacteria bacterium]